MDFITLSAQIGADHRLVLDLPPEIAPGLVEITIRIGETSESQPVKFTRESARTRLLAAGRLVTDIHAPEDTVLLSDEELRGLIFRQFGMPSLDQIVDEDRGPR